MKNIGVVGLGFVGSAVTEGMKHAFSVHGYDKNRGKFINGMRAFSFEAIDPFEYIVRETDGPIFVCVPTPMNQDGSCNVDIVDSVVKEISDANKQLKKDNIVVAIKSTVTPGTTLRLNQKYSNISVCFNPEFLTERNNIDDFKKQDHIIVGGPHKGTAILKQMYETAYPSIPVTKTSSTIAEMVKYMTNCFLAVKVSFANELQQMCDKMDVDFDKVVEYATKDKRLGTSHWSVPGPDGKKGFSGSCFPKDLNALINVAQDLDVPCYTMEGAWDTNLRVRPDKDWEQLKGRAVVD